MMTAGARPFLAKKTVLVVADNRGHQPPTYHSVNSNCQAVKAALPGEMMEVPLWLVEQAGLRPCGHSACQ